MDRRGFKVLKLKRTNSNRMIQSCMNVLQSWRANNDVKILIFDTNAYNPDMEKISNVVDYLVAYTCKGHITAQAEQQVIVDLISG